ncbi:hypothetical protein F4810DRAFT_708884 [Camillea tinctor]|nr:hypothetical protein F4810DRAFT_708884 [Camillea tinctor]
MTPAQFDVIPEKQTGFSRFTPLVVGSNCGVGLETSRQLLNLGVRKLILAVHNEEKGKAAAADLSASRKDMLQDIIEVWKRTLNASTGHDEIILVNYISTALLTILILPVAKAVRENQPQPIRITLALSEVGA